VAITAASVPGDAIQDVRTILEVLDIPAEPLEVIVSHGRSSVLYVCTA
jgi:hypothetical protein